MLIPTMHTLWFPNLWDFFHNSSEPHRITCEAYPDQGDVLSCGWHAAFVSMVPDLSPCTLLLSFFLPPFFFLSFL